MAAAQQQPTLSEVLALVLQADPALLDRTAAIGGVPGWDSMQQVVLMSMLEQSFTVRFSAEEITGCASVPLIEAALARHGVVAAWSRDAA